MHQKINSNNTELSRHDCWYLFDNTTYKNIGYMICIHQRPMYHNVNYCHFEYQTRNYSIGLLRVGTKLNSNQFLFIWLYLDGYLLKNNPLLPNAPADSTEPKNNFRQRHLSSFPRHVDNDLYSELLLTVLKHNLTVIFRVIVFKNKQPLWWGTYSFFKLY